MMDHPSTTVVKSGVPRIPDFQSMPRGLVAYRLSQDGRQETANIRRTFLSLHAGSRRVHANQGGDAKEMSRALTSSAPPGFRVKDISQRNHVVLCGTNPKRMSRKTFEERARQRVKNYISKQIYKIPTSQRPEFSIKVQVDLTPIRPYPKGTLPSANCHFNYIAPKKFIEENYKVVSGKTTTRNSEMNARQLSKSEAKRNKLIEKLISANKPDDNLDETNDAFKHSIKTQAMVSVPGLQQTPSYTSLESMLNAKESNNKNNYNSNSNNNNNNKNTTLEGNGNCVVIPSPSSVPRSKTVAFSLQSDKNTPRWNTTTSQKENHNNSFDVSKSILLNQNHHNSQIQRNQNNHRQRMTSADISSAHARYHFIHPEWPSELIDWARYSHPTTSERSRHSFI